MAVQESAAEKSDNSDPSTYVEVCLQSTVLSHLHPVATAVPSSGLPTDDADSAYDRHWKEVLITRFPTLMDCMSCLCALGSCVPREPADLFEQCPKLKTRPTFQRPLAT